MKCPNCGSKQIQRNGHRHGKQNHRCKNCGRQFIEAYSQRGYSNDVKQICLKMYRSRIGVREIKRLTGISYNTITKWVKQEGLWSSKSDNSEMLEETDFVCGSQQMRIYAIAEHVNYSHSHDSTIIQNCQIGILQK